MTPCVFVQIRCRPGMTYRVAEEIILRELHSELYSTSGQFDLLMITCGEQDPRIDGTRATVSQMKQHGVDLEFKTYPGVHEWQVWRKSIRDFLPLLFR